MHPHFWEGKGKGKHETEKFLKRKKKVFSVRVKKIPRLRRRGI
jgi:hypothetical protein